MAIDVLNHIWVGVFSASFVQQYGDRMRAGYGPADTKACMRYVEEAGAIADSALEAYRLDTSRPAPASEPRA